MSNFKYLAIYKTALVEGTPIKVVIDPVKIEITKEARSYKIPIQQSSVLPKGKGGLISRERELVLQPGFVHIILTARTEETNPYLGSAQCEENLDATITYLSLVYHPDIFADLVYRGWQWEDKVGVMEAWMKVSNPITVTEKLMEDGILGIKKNQTGDSDISARIKVMSRFYAKVVSMPPSPEKYLLLWTILEVYPMKNTSDIKPISETLSVITGHHVQDVKNKLNIGRLYGTRCNLVHNGIFDISIKDMGGVFTKLENIVLEILRHVSKIPYAHLLDSYFS